MWLWHTPEVILDERTRQFFESSTLPKKLWFLGCSVLYVKTFSLFLLVSRIPTKRIHNPQNSTYQKWCFRTRRWRNIQLIWSFRRRVLGFLEENTWSGWVGVSLVGWVGRLVALCCVGWLFFLAQAAHLLPRLSSNAPSFARALTWTWRWTRLHALCKMECWCWWWDEGSLVSLFKTNHLQSKNQFHWEIIM